MKLNKFAITLFLLLALLATVTLAQDDEKTTSTSSPARAEPTTTTTTTVEEEKKTTSTTEAPKETSTTTEVEKETSTTEETTETTPTEGPPALTTSTTSTSTSETSEVVVITDESGATLPPKPKLTTAKEYPKPTVPPTAGAPFMQKSSVPEGTFFIAVGAALGFLMFSVFAWRMIVAWSLHRSVKRAAEQANVVDSKAMLRPPQIGNSGGFYAAGAGSAVSLGDLSRGGAAAKQTPNGSSLFFSPTAGVNASGDRRSAYLPAGYYPTNASGSLGPNSSQTHFHSHSVSSRYGSYDRRGLGPSPPGSPLISPSMPPSRGGNGSPALRGSESRTSLSIPPLPGQRAPSAYLEDLFENHQQQPGGRY